MLSPQQVQEFRDNGCLIVRGVLSPDELEELREASAQLIENGFSLAPTASEKHDFQFGTLRGGGEKILRRVEYLQSKDAAFLRLLAHPILLDAAQKVVGEQFVPTYDSLVVKMPQQGVEVPWHRDDTLNAFWDDPASGRRFPAVNFDFYLDEANAQTGALFVVPGSNRDQVNRAPELAKRGEYESVPGAVRLNMEPGDLMLHDVTLYHGSPETRGSSQMRRVIYYEFRDLRFIEARHRPQNGESAPHLWTREFTNDRLALVQKAIDARRAAGQATWDGHPAPQLRVPSDIAARVPVRQPHPGWDETVATL